MGKYIVYHGTNQRFSRFDLNKTAQGIIWFSDSISDIRSGEAGALSSKIILKCQITINNPAGWDEYEKYGIGELIGKKYDGVILPVKEGVNNYVCFKSSQIKILGEMLQNEPLSEQLQRMKSLSGIPELNEILSEDISGKKPVFHGTPDRRFSVTKNTLRGQHSDDLTGGNNGVIWFTDNKNTAKSYADPKNAWDYQNAEPAVLQRFIRCKNPLVVDAKGALWRRMELNLNGTIIQGTRQLVQYAKENGYDGICIKNVYDNYNHFKGEELKKKYLANTYAVFDDGQVSHAPHMNENTRLQPRFVYHGADFNNLKGLQKNFQILSPEEKMKLPSTGGGHFGLSTSVDKIIGKKYSSRFGTQFVLKIEVGPGANIRPVDTGGKGIDDVFTWDDLEQLAAQGVDGVLETDDGAELELRILRFDHFKPVGLEK